MNDGSGGVVEFQPERRRNYMEPGPGRWRAYLGSAVVTCPDCKFTAGLLGSHRIAQDGLVTPEFVCPGDYCRYRHQIRLAGWMKARNVENLQETAPCSLCPPDSPPQKSKPSSLALAY